MAEYRTNNKEKIEQIYKDYRQKNKAILHQRKINNREKLNATRRAYHEENKDEVNAKNKEQLKCSVCNREMNFR